MIYFFFSKEPPTDDELRKNLAIMQMKKINAAKLDEQYGKPEPQKVTGSSSFPVYKEYETVAGNKKKGDES